MILMSDTTMCWYNALGLCIEVSVSFMLFLPLTTLSTGQEAVSASEPLLERRGNFQHFLEVKIWPWDVQPQEFNLLYAVNNVHLFRGTNLFQYECLLNFHMIVKGALCHILTPAYKYVLKLPTFSMERVIIGGGSCNFLMVRLGVGLLYD